jgi:hypothetical protein
MEVEMTEGNPTLQKAEKAAIFSETSNHTFSPAYEMLTYTTICTLAQLSGHGLRCDKKKSSFLPAQL